MPKATEKRLAEQGITVQEVKDYRDIHGEWRTMEHYGIKDYTAFHRVVGNADTSSLFMVSAEIDGKNFAGFIQQLLDTYYRMRDLLKEKDTVIEKQAQRIEYLESMSSKAWLPKMSELMKVCREER